MKKIIIIAAILLLCMHITATAATVGDMVKENLEASEMEELDDVAQNQDELIIPNFEFSDATAMFAAGATPFNPGSMLSGIIKGFFKEVYVSLILLIKIIAIAIMFSLLQNLKSNLNSDGISNTAFFVCYALLAGVIFQAFLQAANLLQSVVQNITIFVSGIAPIIISSMMASGEVATATAINPVMLLSTQVTTSLINYFLVPIFFVMAALSIVENLNEKFPISKLTDFLKKTVKWSLGLVLTLFVGIMGISGFTTSVLDGATGKAAKYVVGSFVPVVGNILAETVDTTVGCSLVIKNAVGAAGIVAIVVICLTPVLKLAAISAIFHLTAAVIEPISDTRISKTVSSIGSLIGMMVATLLSVGLMFIICISMMIGLGNNAAMLR